MPTKKVIWECEDGVKFTTKEEALKHERNAAMKGVLKVWYDGCIECPSDIIEWIHDNRQLVFVILDSQAQH
jgi:hypothetical protein